MSARISWADIADEEDALAAQNAEAAKAAPPKPPAWIPPHAREAKQKLKNLFSKEKNPK